MILEEGNDDRWRHEVIGLTETDLEAIKILYEFGAVKQEVVDYFPWRQKIRSFNFFWIVICFVLSSQMLSNTNIFHACPSNF